jgi:hypothetical protein
MPAFARAGRRDCFGRGMSAGVIRISRKSGMFFGLLSSGPHSAPRNACGPGRFRQRSSYGTVCREPSCFAYREMALSRTGGIARRGGHQPPKGGGVYRPPGCRPLERRASRGACVARRGLAEVIPWASQDQSQHSTRWTSPDGGRPGKTSAARPHGRARGRDGAKGCESPPRDSGPQGPSNFGLVPGTPGPARDRAGRLTAPGYRVKRADANSSTANGA